MHIARLYNPGYTIVVKITVAIPDPILRAAESLAKRLGVSRSELFSRALKVYIEAHKHDRVREALDEVYAEEPSDLDQVLAQIQWSSLPREDW